MFETLHGSSDIERVGAVNQPYWKICGEFKEFEAEVTFSLLLSKSYFVPKQGFLSIRSFWTGRKNPYWKMTSQKF